MKEGSAMRRRTLKVLAHLLNGAAAAVTLATCRKEHRGAWCSVYAGVALAIELVDAAAEAGWLA
jgi:hypothetical protein